jgi:Tfp pilus assembly protein PilO
MNLRSPGATKIVGALALLVVVALGWMFVVGPETARLSEVREEIQNTRDQNDTLRLQLVALERQRQELGETRRTARALAVKFPTTADQPGLFEAVTAAAVDAGIGAKGVTTLAPTPPVIGGADPSTGVQLDAPAGGAQLARQSVSVSVQGSYEQTRRLLANLEQMERAYLVTSVTLGAGGETGTFTTTVVGDMFVMPPVPEPDLEAAGGAPEAEDPADTDAQDDAQDG